MFGQKETMPAAVEQTGRHCLAHVQTGPFELIPANDHGEAESGIEAGPAPETCGPSVGTGEAPAVMAWCPVIAVHRNTDPKTGLALDEIRMLRLQIPGPGPDAARHHLGSARPTGDRGGRRGLALTAADTGPSRGAEADDIQTNVPSFPTWFLEDPLGRQIIEELVRPEHIVILYEEPEDGREIASKLDRLRQRRPSVAVSRSRGRSAGE